MIEIPAEWVSGLAVAALRLAAEGGPAVLMTPRRSDAGICQAPVCVAVSG